MIWFTWRQFRVPALIAASLLAVAAVALAVTGQSLASQWTDSGAAACQTDCSAAIKAFLSDVSASANGVIYQAAVVLVYVLPVIVGLFWGAPLIARELEAGTHRLAWTQSVTRARWLATKLALAGASAAVVAGLLSWGVSVWSHHIDETKYFRITPLIFGARGIVPIGYALFALAVGVTMGMLIRRTVPAMAATLGIYVAAMVSVPLWVRAHLLPAVHSTGPVDLTRLDDFSLRMPSLEMKIVSGIVPDGSWVLVNNTITSTGAVFTGPADPQFCGEGHGPRDCLEWVGTLGLRQDLVYQPASHFWPLQWVETGIFAALAAALFGFCFWWVRRRFS